MNEWVVIGFEKANHNGSTPLVLAKRRGVNKDASRLLEGLEEQEVKGFNRGPHSKLETMQMADSESAMVSHSLLNPNLQSSEGVLSSFRTTWQEFVEDLGFWSAAAARGVNSAVCQPDPRYNQNWVPSLIRSVTPASLRLCTACGTSESVILGTNFPSFSPARTHRLTCSDEEAPGPSPISPQAPAVPIILRTLSCVCATTFITWVSSYTPLSLMFALFKTTEPFRSTCRNWTRFPDPTSRVATRAKVRVNEQCHDDE
ncbi:ankyrin repeat domain-containing protein 46 [Lates japonicus]|uniref:Ankyrin repeat domain-containing protein 46 n=1 Tax=Lates japonicus TaxID=270547 RepID=A0AAD3NH09_LATJO|nr:ankyrin repeat domain-containing protein 46 [Lates japonicus]